jgi:predicted dehydrogenase
VTSLAFAGAGWVTAVHGLAADALDSVHVVHVASRRGVSAGRRAEQTGAVACEYADLPGGADAVLVATPPPWHRQEAERAVDGGAAALVETPLASTLADADAIVALGERGQVAYGENLAYAPGVAEAVSACRRIGALTYLEVRFAQGRPDWARHRLEPEWGGGAFFDLGVHAVAVALLLAAPARAVSVKGGMSPGHGLEIDDEGAATIAFDTGLQAHVRATWRAASPTWDAQTASATGAVRLELVPNPSVTLNGVELPLPPPGATAGSPQLHHLGYISQLAALAADVDAHRKPRMTAQFGRYVLDVVCAAYRSARTGEPEALPFAGARDRTPHQLWTGD